MPKIKVGLIYGGESPEHDVSLMTAESIRENIDRDKFEVKDIFIDKSGALDESLLKDIDVAFLAVHGPNCEDGKLQQFLENRNIRYTGSGIDASEINMSKTLMHNIFKQNDLPVVQYCGFKEKSENISAYINRIGFPFIIKPDNMGSSIGMSKVNNRDDINKALALAFNHDNKIIVEKFIHHPREIEVAVLGNADLIVSNPGEIITHGEIYSYETKYGKPFSTTLTPDLSPEQIEDFRLLAERAYRITGCAGYARVDFLMDNEQIYLNEINTLPGFTSISMFPKLMANIGISYQDLISRIIELALE